jgi:hypothetical protein
MEEENSICPFVKEKCIDNCRFQNAYGECLVTAAVGYTIDKMITENIISNKTGGKYLLTEHMTEEEIKMKMEEIITFARLSRKYVNDKELLNKFYGQLLSQIPARSQIR